MLNGLCLWLWSLDTHAHREGQKLAQVRSAPLHPPPYSY